MSHWGDHRTYDVVAAQYIFSNTFQLNTKRRFLRVLTR